MSSNTQPQHVIFGTGPLGQAVMRECLCRGYAVRMINTRGLADVPKQVQVVKGDAYSAQNVRELTQDAQVVYQCAEPAYHEWTVKFPVMQASIIEGVAANGAKLILAENLYMYGEVSGKIHEDLPYAATTRKGRTRAQMAEAAVAAHRAGKIRIAIGRGSNFFGPGALASFFGERAIYPALVGKPAQLLGQLDLPHTYTFIDDFGSALVTLGERDEALGQVWHVPNDCPTITQRQLIELFFQEIGLPPKMSSMGKGMVTIGGLFNADVRETVEMMYEVEKPFVVDSRKFERAFQMQATPIREAVRSTVAWFRAHPKREQ